MSKLTDTAKSVTTQGVQGATRSTPWFGLCAVAFLFLHLGGIAGFAEASLWWFPVIALLPFECLMIALGFLGLCVGLFFLVVFIVLGCLEIPDMIRQWSRRRTMRKAAKIRQAMENSPKSIAYGTKPLN